MTRLTLLPGALAYHLYRHAAALAGVAVMAGATAGILAALGGPRPGVPSPAGPPAAAVVAGAFLHMTGAVAGEAHCGRATLWILASGGRLRWLALDLALRLGALLITTVATAGLAAAACAFTDPAAAAALWAAVPFFCLLAGGLAAVAYGCSALAARLDPLLAALYVVPGTLLSAAAMARADGVRPLWTFLALPVDALMALAPGSAPPGPTWPGPPPTLHLAVFVGGWLALGLTAGRWRTHRLAPRG